MADDMFVDKIKIHLNQIIHLILILAVGGVGSLTFFDAFTPEHGPHAYHLTFLAEEEHSPLPSPPEVVAGYQVDVLFINLTLPLLNVPQGFMSGLALFFSSGLSSGYLLTDDQLEFSSLSPVFNASPAEIMYGKSAYLSHLEKPPRQLQVVLNTFLLCYS